MILSWYILHTYAARVANDLTVFASYTLSYNGIMLLQIMSYIYNIYIILQDATTVDKTTMDLSKLTSRF